MRFLAWVTLVFVFVACGSDPLPEAANKPANEAGRQLLRDWTPSPTATSTPTATPTSTPTATPSPTPIPIPPTPRPQAPPVSGQGGDETGAVFVEQCGRSFPASVTRWIPLFMQYSWNLCSALAVVDCESDGDEAIVNASSGACGLWQHLPCMHNGNGAASTILAYQKYSNRGWQPWISCGYFPP